MTHTFQYGATKIDYEVLFVKRKTLGITVHPDLTVTVKAPVGSSLELIESKLKKKGEWILQQQRELEEFLPTLPPRKYVSGETHLYLGKQYRLKVIEGSVAGVKLTRGRFFVFTKNTGDTEKVRELLTSWYREKAQAHFTKRLEVCYQKAKRYDIDYPRLQIRIMKTRWGSCAAKGSVLLNLKLIQVPTFCIDYVVMHELAHMNERYHNAAYYELLDKLMPDWRERRQELNGYKVA